MTPLIRLISVPVTAVALSALMAGCTASAREVDSAAPPVSTCGWWGDYSTSAGRALSAIPGQTPKPGDKARVEGTGAWKVCISVSAQTICLKTGPQLCLQNVGGIAKWEVADETNAYQDWTFHERSGPQGGWYILNAEDGSAQLGAEGGGGGIVALGQGDVNRSTWAWTSQPQVRGNPAIPLN
jgi:hypothetical protein